MYRFLQGAIFLLIVLFFGKSYCQIEQYIPLNNWHFLPQSNLNQNDSELSHYETVSIKDFTNQLQIDFVKDLGGDNTGFRDNSQLLQSFIDESSEPVIINFQSGKYLFQSTLNLRSNIVLTGRSPYTTHFYFDLNNIDEPLFLLQGEEKLVTITRDIEIDFQDNSLTSNDVNELSIGDIIEIEIENSKVEVTKEKEWSKNAVGIIAEITNKIQNTIWIDKKITYDFSDTLRDKHIRIIKPLENVGFEKFTIKRIDHGRAATFKISNAKFISIKCINSIQAGTNHVELYKTIYSTIYGSRFYDAHYHCTGGTGYGVWCGRHSSENLIENNIFERLRHAMIVSIGANNNVFSYNFSYNQYSNSGDISSGYCGNPRTVLADISIHGNFPFNNLFEQNLVNYIHIDGYWGPAGYSNTFFRNRVYRSDGEPAIVIDSSSNKQVFVENILPYSGFEIQNPSQVIVNNKSLPNEGDYFGDLQTPPSLYQAEKPLFLGKKNWPFYDIKNLISSDNSIPAKERSLNGRYFDNYCCGAIPGLNGYFDRERDILVYEADDELYIESPEMYIFDVLIIDTMGKVYQQAYNLTSNTYIRIDKMLLPEVFIVSLINSDFSESFRIVNNEK